MPLNRVVALLTPILAPAVGFASKWLVENTGVDIPPQDLNTVFIGGALVALAPALQWLHGWQKYEAREAEIQGAVEVASAGAIAATAEMSEELGDEFGDEFEDDYDEYDGQYYEYDDEYGDEDEVQLDEPAPAVT